MWCSKIKFNGRQCIGKPLICYGNAATFRQLIAGLCHQNAAIDVADLAQETSHERYPAVFADSDPWP
jgi:hypothetical protein